MKAEEYLKEGNLNGALEALQEAVRADASNPKLRIFLFQLLCVLGDWNRAIAQLKLCGELAPEAVPMAQAYREGIVCEVYRAKVFAGEKEPLVFGEPQEWIAMMITALKSQVSGKTEEAAALRKEAFELAPAVAGEMNGEAFEWIGDADSRLGPLLEVVVNGRYFWMPFSAIESASFEPPTDLRDFVWMPGTLTLANGGEVVAFVPARYAGTVESGSDAEKLGRSTSWSDEGGGSFIGRGQRMLATDQADTALMDVRTLSMSIEAGA
jgi:type VI secretion system protein ImpE